MISLPLSCFSDFPIAYSNSRLCIEEKGILAFANTIFEADDLVRVPNVCSTSFSRACWAPSGSPFPLWSSPHVKVWVYLAISICTFDIRLPKVGVESEGRLHTIFLARGE